MKSIFKFIFRLTFFFQFFIGINLQAKTLYGQNTNELETIDWIWSKAQKFSNLQSLNNGITFQIWLMSDLELSEQACPEDKENCHGMAGLFDSQTQIIYLREDLIPHQDMISASFLIHEMVHYLQFMNYGENEMFKDCEHLYQTEKLAYDSQDLFLKSEGQFFRAGSFLRFFLCQD